MGMSWPGLLYIPRLLVYFQMFWVDVDYLEMVQLRLLMNKKCCYN